MLMNRLPNIPPNWHGAALSALARVIQSHPQGGYSGLMNALAEAVPISISVIPDFHEVFEPILRVVARDPSAIANKIEFAVVLAHPDTFVVLIEMMESAEYDLVGVVPSISEACGAIGLTIAEHFHGQDLIECSPGGLVKLSSIDPKDQEVWVNLLAENTKVIKLFGSTP